MHDPAQPLTCYDAAETAVGKQFPSHGLAMQGRGMLLRLEIRRKDAEIARLRAEQTRNDGARPEDGAA